jgi:signal transduction histidine kinase
LRFHRNRLQHPCAAPSCQPVGAIVHDPALLEEGHLLDSASAAAQLAMENERLHAEIRSTLEEVRASRTRIVEAGDAERRRVERNLHDGAQQRLLSLSLGLSMVRDLLGPQSDPALIRLLDESRRDASQAIAELRDLAQGIHPAVLTEEGLSAAVESLVERASVPVSASAPAERYPPSIEATVYFVISEALANVAKYARATRSSVRVARIDGSLIVEVEDDGLGGADPTRGSGLRGLDDRVATMGGRLEIESQPERGTRVRAVIPCD